MKTTYPLLLFVLLLAACSTAETEPATNVAPEKEAEVAAAVAAPTDTVLPASPTTPAEPLAPTVVPTAEAAATAAADAEAEATEPAAAEPPPVEPEPVEEATMNGPYEGTYFRGSPDAPVTMIDYSDFL